MPFRIQRVPQGLNNLLSIFGGNTPIDLEDRIRGTLETTQFYGLQQQRVVFATNAALAENSVVTAVNAASGIKLNANGEALEWAVLFGATGVIVKTGTMTAARLTVEMQRRGAANSIALAGGELGPFGATETGAAGVTFWAPYPILLPPPWTIFTRLQILGTDATAQVTCIAELGILQ